MRIAFASCMSAQVFPDQPVWDWIAQADPRPDRLLLLGDSIYLDIGTPKSPMAMGNDEFARHLFAYWRAQLAQPQFNALLKTLGPGHIHAIWDDHDFLWNDACGAAIAKQPTQREKIPLSNAFFNAFRRALDAPDNFPSAYNDAVFWNAAEPSPDVSNIDLGGDVWLHLSDSRSARTETIGVAASKRQMLGGVQRTRMQKDIGAHPAGVHLLANGSTSVDWQNYPNDWAWLLAQAATQRVLLVTGDIHKNNVALFDTGGFPLHEATSSGAAVCTLVVTGAQRQNYGLLDVTDDDITLRLFEKNVENKVQRRRYLRDSWQVAP